MDIHVYLHDPTNQEVLGLLRRILDNQAKEKIIMAQMDDEITQLTADVTALRGAEDSALALINGFSAKLDAAVAAATAAGATPAQLQAIADLSTAVKADTADLAKAVAANP